MSCGWSCSSSSTCSSGRSRMHVGAETSPWGVVFYLLLTTMVIASMLLIPAVLGQRHRERTTGERYESGLPPASDLPRRFSIEFYLVAMLFVVFDLESAFIFAWAVAARAPGLDGLHRDRWCSSSCSSPRSPTCGGAGALDWGTSGRRKRRARGLTVTRRVREQSRSEAALQRYWAGRDGRAGAPPVVRRAAAARGLGPRELAVAVQLRPVLLLRRDGHQPHAALRHRALRRRGDPRLAARGRRDGHRRHGVHQDGAR